MPSSSPASPFPLLPVDKCLELPSSRGTHCPILDVQSNGSPSPRRKVGGLEWVGSCTPQEGEEGLCAEPGCSALEAVLTDKAQVRK